MEGLDLATGVSTKEPYTFTTPSQDVFGGTPRATPPPRFDVVAYDYGLKRSMLQFLVDEGCRVTVVPAATTAEQVLARKPHGVFLANGPGDPAAVKGADRTVANLLGKVPVFGICLGHQILALALGGRTYKMKFGHRGANQPVKDLTTGKVEITAQNHGFAVDDASLKGKAVVTHINLNDGTVEGLSIPDARAFSVQYHPESSPGPHDARYCSRASPADGTVGRIARAPWTPPPKPHRCRISRTWTSSPPLAVRSHAKRTCSKPRRSTSASPARCSRTTSSSSFAWRPFWTSTCMTVSPRSPGRRPRPSSTRSGSRRWPPRRPMPSGASPRPFTASSRCASWARGSFACASCSPARTSMSPSAGTSPGWRRGTSWRRGSSPSEATSCSPRPSATTPGWR
ncbi:carbamoyl-phosphate synthase small chain [Stigmatella aurantiaca DW4/3-1]|uniref:carbamoyl-phosphate synthase (glutamine-hydrolyzing) n=1 Tax=Stigmatella aurantiaca (strain DW4/3-1) TaxID=378806 RepID=Q08SK4_STIAD|nr:carbamoyl-phosphate synthase small chain [Stigmatella aurantiaca DW4/3-1]